MAEKCSICNRRLGGVEHSNGSLGAYSFTEACDACQGAAWTAYRAAEAKRTADVAARMITSGGNIANAPPRPEVA